MPSVSASTSQTPRSSLSVAPSTSQISLVDNTSAFSGLPTPPAGTDDAPRRKRDALRQAIAERKYKRWSMDVEGSEADLSATEEEGRVPDHPTNNTSGEQKGDKTPEITETDILYENQRGWFLCGIPLFSSKSLLNFDPAPWQNRLFRDSAVSIYDAQPPDPSWIWDWKNWYVDMTADVDEEGWSYSFSFSPAFAWHGNHVWFNSFVRRRRWLRRRVKLQGRKGRSPGDMGEGSAHGMNADYFTIHSKRERSSWYAGSAGQQRGVEEHEDEPNVPITDMPALLRVVKKARLDREKVEAVVRFIVEGGEEIAYLPEKIPSLMQLMLFQSSRKQLLQHITCYLDAIEAGSSPTIDDILNTAASNTPEIEQSRSRAVSPSPSRQGRQTDLRSPERRASRSPSPLSPMAGEERRKRKMENVRKAVAAADEEVLMMEYWSDLKGVTKHGVGARAEGEGWDGLGLGLGGGNSLKDKGKGKEKVDV